MIVNKLSERRFYVDDHPAVLFAVLRNWLAVGIMVGIFWRNIV